MTDHGCTIDGQPALPILVSEHTQLVTRLAEAEAQLAALRAVARGYCPNCGRGDAAPTVQDWERERQRADSAEEASRRALAQRQQMAEAALARARAACDQLERAVINADGRLLTAYDRGVDTAIRRIRNALDTPEPTP